MDILLLILGIVCILIGITGSILPVLPGPSAAWAGLLLLHWSDYGEFSTRFLVITAILAVFTIVLDFIIPGWGSRRFGGSRMGEKGALVGVFAGVTMGPLGIILGPFIGAFIGELLHDRSQVNRAVRAAWGSFVGFLAGTGIKLILCLFFAWYFIRAVWG